MGKKKREESLWNEFWEIKGEELALFGKGIAYVILTCIFLGLFGLPSIAFFALGRSVLIVMGAFVISWLSMNVAIMFYGDEEDRRYNGIVASVAMLIMNLIVIGAWFFAEAMENINGG